jgi:hypothetical protein
MAVFNGSAADIETKKNKVNSISSTPSDENYPSEKAVKDYVDNNSGGGASEEVCWKVETKTVEVCCEAILDDIEGEMVFVLTGNIVEPAEEYGPEDGSVTVDGEQIYVGSLVVGDEGAREYEVFYVKRAETIYIRTPETVGPFDGKPLEGVFTETGEQVYSATTTEKKTAKYAATIDVSTVIEVYDVIIPDDIIDKETIYRDIEVVGEPAYWVTLTKDWYVDGDLWGYEGEETSFVIREEDVTTTVYYTLANVTDSFRIHKEYIDSNLGDIDSALDAIIAIQNSLIGGDSE